MSTLLSALECRPLQSSNADPVSPFSFSINMRGNYVESLRLSPDQPQLKAQIDLPMNMTLIDAGSPKVQQSQTQLEPENRHADIRVQSQQTNIGTPLRGKQSPTVNGWPNTVVVKEEPQDEKNEDSGVSPSYYTSGSECSPNCRAPSTETDNSSPISAFVPSPESIQAANIYNYAMYNSSYAAETATPVATGGNKNKKFGKAKSAIASHVVSSSNGKEEKDRSSVDIAAEPLACPVCPYKTQNRVDFSEHLIVHSGRCDATEVKNSVLEQLTQSGSSSEYSNPQPTSNAQNENETDSQDTVIGMRVPRVNCQGKVKTHKCKQCGYIAITKLDFWEHTRSHIKDEKLLTCPKCPFVTEYKHHLEYHLRNHVGSKPYKCNQCDYTCVNKSMLNSHLKSHSNVYQFRCADCSYATKYCHSLKLHLRKYKHEPAMVLNADGSPNPLPIVDVYGTKRGPKSKPKKEDEEQQQQQQQRLQQGPPPQPDGLQHLQQLQQLQHLQQLHQQQLVQQAQAQQAQVQIEPPQPAMSVQNDVNEQMTLMMHQSGLNRLPAVPQFPLLPLQAAALQSAALTNGLMPQFNMGLMNLLCTSLFNPFSLPNVFSLNNDNGNINQQQLEHMARIRDSILDYIRKYGNANEAPEPDDQPLNCVSPSRYSADHNDNSEDQEDGGDQALDLTKA